MTTTAGTCDDCGDHWLLHDTGGCAYRVDESDTTTEETA